MTKAAETPEPRWLRVCPLEQILPNMGVCCLVGREQVAVFRLSNFDPFSRANVLSRGIVGDRAGRAKVASPIYKQSFALDTGECLDDPNVKLPTFEVRVNDGIVEVREQVTHALRIGNSELINEARTA
jgi:nitrite reductase (NADH) small subunit